MPTFCVLQNIENKRHARSSTEIHHSTYSMYHYSPLYQYLCPPVLVTRHELSLKIALLRESEQRAHH